MPEARSDGFWRALWRHKWMIAASILIGLALGSYHGRRQVPMFASRSILLFEQFSKPGPDGSSVNDPYLKAQADLLVSTTVLDAAAQMLKKQHLKSLEPSTNITNALQDGIRTRVSKQDGTIALSYVCPVATDSAAIVNAVVDAYRDLESLHRQSAATDAFVQWQQAKDRADAEVNADMAKIQEFKSRNPDFLLSDGNGTNLAGQKLAQLNAELTDAQANAMNLQARYDSLALQSVPAETPSNSPSADDADTDVDGAKSELHKATTNLDMLIAKGLPPTDSSVQDARGYVARLRSKLAICQRNADYAELARSKLALDLARRRLAEFQAAFDAQKAAVMGFSAKASAVSSLQDQLTRAQHSREELDARIRQISVTQNVPIDLRVLEKAVPADQPLDLRIKTVGEGGAAGLLLGFVLSLGLYLIDGRMRTPGDVARVLGLPVLGVIPNQAGKQSVFAIGFRSHTDPMSDIAEAARSVRTALFAASRSTPVKTVLVTSPKNGDGKSVFAVNLAIAMAQAGSRTLLIDANFGEPVMQNLFEIRKLTGLSNVLSGYITAEKTINRTPVERLEVIPSGQKPRNSTDLLNSKAFTTLMEQLSTRYQCIILDASAVLDRNDSRILGASADITVYIVRAGRTTANVAHQGLDQLLSVGTRVFGVVVNDVPMRYVSRRVRGSMVGEPAAMGVASGLDGGEAPGDVTIKSNQVVVPEVDVDIVD